MTRGIRNKNPGNLRHGSDWAYLAAYQSLDPEFCIFQHHVFGIRALCKLLVNYSRRHDLFTIDGIINRFAPASENDVEAYINHVCQYTGWKRDEPINLLVSVNLIKLAEAIILHENGMMPYTHQDLEFGAFLGLST